MVLKNNREADQEDTPQLPQYSAFNWGGNVNETPGMLHSHTPLYSLASIGYRQTELFVQIATTLLYTPKHRTTFNPLSRTRAPESGS